jgi:hypothetical protein
MTGYGTFVVTDTGPSLLKRTDMIPRTRGVVFGYSFIVEGSPQGAPLPVVFKVLHPPIRKPGSPPASESRTLKKVVAVGEPAYNVISLDSDWDKLPDQWTLQVYCGPRLLVEKVFTVE